MRSQKSSKSLILKASPEDIKMAYRIAAQEWYPDKILKSDPISVGKELWTLHQDKNHSAIDERAKLEIQQIIKWTVRFIKKFMKHQ